MRIRRKNATYRKEAECGFRSQEQCNHDCNYFTTFQSTMQSLRPLQYWIGIACCNILQIQTYLLKAWLRTTRRSIPDEAREPSVDVLMRARDQRWNRLGHILRMEEHRFARQVLLQCVKPTPELVFDYVPGLEVEVAMNLAKKRVGWKRNRPSWCC